MRTVPILAYHRVHTDDDPTIPAVESGSHCGHVTLSVFRRQMAALAERGFTTVNHARIADWLCGRKDLPDGPTVALGFDDNRLNVSVSIRSRIFSERARIILYYSVLPRYLHIYVIYL